MSDKVNFKNKPPRLNRFYAHVNEDKTVTVGIERTEGKKTTARVYFLSRRQVKSLASLLESASGRRL